jgi:phage tail sheath protein FI
MAATYLSPGVYVEEIDRASKPIEGVGTAVAAFVGFAEKGPIGEPTLITNWSQFASTFGSGVPGGFLGPSIYGYFNNGGGTCYVTRLPGSLNGQNGASGDTSASAALPATQASLPSRASAETPTLTATARAGVGGEVSVEVRAANPGSGASEDQFTVVVRGGGAEETFSNVTLGHARGARNAVETINRESRLVRLAEQQAAGTLAERAPAAGVYSFTASSTALVPITPNSFIGSADERTGILGLEVAETATVLCAPDVMAAYLAGQLDEAGVRAVQQAMLDHCAAAKDRVAILDSLPNQTPQQIREWRQNAAGYDSSYGALYYPWLQVPSTNGNGNGSSTMLVPPSGHVAGIWARNDSERGVHKAPANEVVRGAIGLEKQLTRNEQDTLNPIGINCIRAFPGRGIRVWGARTLSSDASWRYLNVRRLFNYVEESIDAGTQWTVFEPNDQYLWSKVVRDVSAFLTRVWRDGALFGTSPTEAFYVKCDLELNPPEVRDAGILVCEVGIAPVKPAEFVVFRISQFSDAGGGGAAPAANA